MKKIFFAVFIFLSAGFIHAEDLAQKSDKNIQENYVAIPLILGVPNVALVGLQYERRIFSFGAEDSPKFITFGADYRYGVGYFDSTKDNYKTDESFHILSIFGHFYFLTTALGRSKYFNGFFIGPILNYYLDKLSLSKLGTSDPEVSGSQQFKGFGLGGEVGFNINFNGFVIGISWGFVYTGTQKIQYIRNNNPNTLLESSVILTTSGRFDLHAAYAF